jgi:DMSO/TMAO reductase YedYZ molybdopterin-dependent catalytic subunit
VRGAGAGLVASLVALGVAELVAALVRPQASPVIAVGGSVIDATPVWLKDFAIRTFGTNDKPVLIGSILMVLVTLALLTGALAVRRIAVGLLGIAVLGLVGAAAALTRPGAGPADALPSLVGAFVGALVLVALLRRLPATSPTDEEHDTSTVSAGRRRFLLAGLGAAGVGILAGSAGRLVSARRGAVAAARADVRLPEPVSPAAPVPRGSDLKLPDLSPFRTPNSDFYRVDTALVVPQVSTEGWTLRVHGMVEREIELDFDQLLDRGLVERDVTLTCVSNEVGGKYVGNARWLGVLLADLLREAGVQRRADMILSRSADGMTISTPTAVVMDGRDALLAVGMNGAPLPPEHGFPVRMVVPGLYGYVSATKWLVELELTRFDRVEAYWTERGWAEQAPIKTMSRVDTPKPFARLRPGPVAVAGVAWAQHRGIERVEVRVDEGPWQLARLAEVPSVDTWRQWVWQWEATRGSHTLEVRATDRAGMTQPARRADPFPSGATGWHSTVVTVA